ncbi:glycosyltransferase family 2 protein [Orrella daihaiensis]
MSDCMLSCVVPAFNEHDNLAVLLPKLKVALQGLTDAWEVIVVDDGSSDNTSDLMGMLSREPGIRYLQLSRNFGKEAALTAGIEAAEGDAVVLMDADLQHPPALLKQMVQRWETGVDMIYAVRESREDERWGKRIGTKLFYSLLRSESGVQVPPHAGDFRLMDRAVVTALMQLPERDRFMKGLYAWVGFRSEAIPFMPESRLSGKSHFSAWRLWRLAMAGLMSFTTWPLRAVSVMGFVVSICSFLYGIYIVGEFILYDNPVDGWPTIVTILLFFSGINLLSLGVVGEYIARVFKEVKHRPVYLVRQSMGASARTERPEAAKDKRQRSHADQNESEQELIRQQSLFE